MYMQRNLKNWRRTSVLVQSALILCSCISAALAVAPNQPPDLGPTPPDVTASVSPNIVLTFDNSGSMASEYIPDAVNDQVTVRRYYSSDWNLIYFDPIKAAAGAYQPGLLPDGSAMANATYAAAWKDGICTNRPAGGPTTCSTGLTGTANLSTGFGAAMNNGSNGNNSNSNISTLSNAAGLGAQNGAIYATNIGTAACIVSTSNPNPADSCYTLHLVPAALQPAFANWYSYYRFRNLMARTGISRSFAILGTNVRVAWQNIGDDGNNPNNNVLLNAKTAATIDIFAGTLRTNFFNWLYANVATINTPNRAALVRAGHFFQQGAGVSNTTNPYWDAALGKELSCRQNFQMLVTDGYWNEQNPSTSSSLNAVDATAIKADTIGLTLPDGTAYTPSSQNESKLFWNEAARTNKGCSNTAASSGSVVCAPTLADIGFYFWATDLRPDLTNNVPPYFPDLATGLTEVPAQPVNSANPGSNLEIYYNPRNDPATWQHAVQFIIGLGVPGTLKVPQTSPPAAGDTNPVHVGDFDNLRAGTVQWPQITNNDPTALNDTWHATMNSRGGYFNAGDPQQLITALTGTLNSIVARQQTSTSESVSTSIFSTSTLGYSGGYDSTVWSGYLYNATLDSLGNPAATLWDAGCILTGGTFTPIAPTSTSPPRGQCAASGTTVAPARTVFTSIASGSTLVGAAFTAAGLGTGPEFKALNLSPTTIVPSTTTGLITGTGTVDGNAADRISYLRGVRTYESTPTLTPATPTQFRQRTSVLGAIINSQVLFEGGPSSAWFDTYPYGSPEEVAARPCLISATAPGCFSYEAFSKSLASRPKMLYAGANDGMLHAFDAVTGSEVWAYVPNALYANGQLDQITNTKNQGTLVSAVDDTPFVQDVFINGKWRTVLVGSLRLGGRGIYVLDVTDSTKPASDTAAATKFMWEFSSDNSTNPNNDPDLGYTYASANIARLRCNVAPCSGTGVTNTNSPGGTWVVLVSSGYYPKQLSVQTNGNSNIDAAPGVSATITHLWVLDLATGKVIKKLNTTAGVTSYGLSTPGLVDVDSDQLDDIADAGDLAGNLWRFDLSDPNPANWRVDNIFQTYTSAANIGEEPITVMPVAFADRVTGADSFIYVFGSGEYLGNSDRTAASVLTPQHIFGVRDFGPANVNSPCSPKLPCHETDLVTQTLTQDANGKRSLTNNVVPPGIGTASVRKAGWMIPLDSTKTNEPGERDIVTLTPFYSSGTAVISTLIPGTNDPCQPGRLGAILAVNASTGASPFAPISASGTSAITYSGVLVNNPPGTGSTTVISTRGGVDVLFPGITPACPGGAPCTKQPLPSGLQPVWRQTSWRELLGNT